MQKLFSTFRAGTVGTALLVLRVLIAATYIVDGTAHLALVTSFWIWLIFAMPAFCLCLGLVTPYCATLCLLVQLVVLVATGSSDKFHLATSMLMSGVLALSGPGAYSLDARIFGRRRLVLPPRW
jgi:hypothetical protein